MKNVIYFLLTCFLMLSTACENGDEETDPNIVKGTWELSKEDESDDQEVYYVETYTFMADGTYENRAFNRDAESGELSCYYRISSGTYNRSGNKLILNASVRLYNPENCGSEEELVDYDDGEPIDSIELIFEITNQGTELTLDYGPCSDMCPPNAFCICIGPQTYTKVD